MVRDRNGGTQDFFASQRRLYLVVVRRGRGRTRDGRGTEGTSTVPCNLQCSPLYLIIEIYSYQTIEHLHHGCYPLHSLLQPLEPLPKCYFLSFHHLQHQFKPLVHAQDDSVVHSHENGGDGAAGGTSAPCSVRRDSTGRQGPGRSPGLRDRCRLLTTLLPLIQFFRRGGVTFGQWIQHCCFVK